MRSSSFMHRSLAATMTAILVAGTPAAAVAAPKAKRPAPSKVVRQSARVASLPAGTQRPTSEVVLSSGRGQLVTLPANVVDVWTSNSAVADVYVSSPRQIHLFGKGDGEATVFATTASGQVVYATNVRVGANITSLDKMLKLAMPDGAIIATTMNGMVLLTGTVAAPSDSEEAERLVKAFLGPETNVVSRLKTATPLQVSLHVKIAEVSRSFVKDIGVNIINRDQSNGGPVFGISQGRNAATISNGANGGTNFAFNNKDASTTTLSIGARFLGMDLAGALDLAETQGLVTTLAEPNLTALSGETASFLAGGEIPLLVSQGGAVNTITVEYKQYGVSLAFTPTVLADGRISMRVRPEVSELTSDGAVVLNGVTISALKTRRVETTVELGSGQGFVIGGLLQNNNNNSYTKTPGVGDVPVLGALFRSNAYRRGETELMIVVTPYLVRPVSASEIVLPTDGYKSPTEAERILLGKSSQPTTGNRPVPTLAPPTTVAGGGQATAFSSAPVGDRRQADRTKGTAIAPGFSQ